MMEKIGIIAATAIVILAIVAVADRLPGCKGGRGRDTVYVRDSATIAELSARIEDAEATMSAQLVAIEKTEKARRKAERDRDFLKNYVNELERQIEVGGPINMPEASFYGPLMTGIDTSMKLAGGAELEVRKAPDTLDVRYLFPPRNDFAIEIRRAETRIDIRYPIIAQESGTRISWTAVGISFGLGATATTALWLWLGK